MKNSNPMQAKLSHTSFENLKIKVWFVGILKDFFILSVLMHLWWDKFVYFSVVVPTLIQYADH